MLTIPRRGLILDLPLNWDAKDYSWNWHDGTPTDVAWVETNIGYQSKCASFNGSSSKIKVDNFDVSNIVCISVWVQVIWSSNQKLLTIWRSSSNINNEIIIYWHNTDTGGFHIWDFDTDYNFLYSWPPINDSLFHHLVLQINNGNYSIYLDNKQIYSYSCRSINYASQPLYIWCDWRDNKDYLNWKVSLLKIYDWVILTEPEIHTLYLEWLRKLTPARNAYL